MARKVWENCFVLWDQLEVLSAQTDCDWGWFMWEVCFVWVRNVFGPHDLPTRTYQCPCEPQRRAAETCCPSFILYTLFLDQIIAFSNSTYIFWRISCSPCNNCSHVSRVLLRWSEWLLHIALQYLLTQIRALIFTRSLIFLLQYLTCVPL